MVGFENFNMARNTNYNSLASSEKTLQSRTSRSNLAHQISVQSLSFNLPDNIHIRLKSDSNWECKLVIGEVRVFGETTG